MHPLPLSLVLLLAACDTAPREAPLPPDPGPAMARVSATLDEAVRLDRDRRDEEARAAWRRAHATFEDQLEPALSAVVEPRELVISEYMFGRVRSEIDQPSGRPADPARELTARLQDQIASLAAAE